MRWTASLAILTLASCSGPAWKSGAAVGNAQSMPLSGVASARPDSEVVLEGTVTRVCQTRG